MMMRGRRRRSNTSSSRTNSTKSSRGQVGIQSWNIWVDKIASSLIIGMNDEFLEIGEFDEEGAGIGKEALGRELSLGLKSIREIGKLDQGLSGATLVEEDNLLNETEWGENLIEQTDGDEVRVVLDFHEEDAIFGTI